jgi:hypothetical protein
MAINSGANETKLYNTTLAALNAALVFVTAEIAIATAASNTTLAAVYTVQQTNLNYQISLMVANSVSGEAVQGFQSDETTPYKALWMSF